MTGYIAEMRKLVGHRTVMQCAASIMCVDEQGRLLLGRRTDNHLWGYSGGALEIDEKVEDCARRELEEEMGLIASTSAAGTTGNSGGRNPKWRSSASLIPGSSPWI